MIQDLSDSKIILIAWVKNVASGISSKRNSMNGCLKSMKKVGGADLIFLHQN